MTTGEFRQKVKRLYPIACTGAVKAVRELATVMRLRRKPKCITCGVPLSKRGQRHCRMHWATNRFYSRKLAAAIMLVPMLAFCQSFLEWDSADQATGYEIYQHVGTNWILIGKTNGLIFQVTNSLSAYGVVGIRTNATNVGISRGPTNYVPGMAPNLRINLQGAGIIDGQYTNIASFVWHETLPGSRFYRAKLEFQ